MRYTLLPLVLLFVPLAAADTGQLSAGSASWQDGEVAASSLVALYDHGEVPWRMSGADLHVRAVVADAYSKIPGAAFYAPRWETTHANYTQASVASQVGRPESFVYVIPAEGYVLPDVALSCGADAQPADEATPQQVPTQIESPNPNPPFPVDQSIAVRPCSELSICGAFTVALWERDATGNAAEGVLDLRSGQLARSGEPDARPALGRAQQLYLTTTNGCFSMTPTGTTGLILESLSLDRTAEIVLGQANGFLQDVAVPAGSDLQLFGSLSLDLGRTDDRLVLAGIEGVDAATLNGSPLPLAAATTGGTGWAATAPLGIGAGTALLLLLVVLIYLRRPSRTEWFLGLGVNQAERGRYWLAAFFADQAARCEPSNAFARVLHAYCMQIEGDYEAALRSRDAAHPTLLEVGEMEAAARSAIEGAWAALQLQDPTGQRLWLQRAFQAEPVVASLLLVDPSKAALRSLALDYLPDTAYT